MKLTDSMDDLTLKEIDFFNQDERAGRVRDKKVSTLNALKLKKLYGAKKVIFNHSLLSGNCEEGSISFCVENNLADKENITIAYLVDDFIETRDAHVLRLIYYSCRKYRHEN